MDVAKRIERVLGGLPNAQPAAVDRLAEIVKDEVALLAPAFRLEIAKDELRRARTVTDNMIRAACNAYGASQGTCEFDWMSDALTAALSIENE